MEKYGFVYIWFDRKHKKYYIGRHWGFENDGYICSSTNMRNNYKNRPYDFKRKIVSKIYTCIEDLIVEEQRWLDMIDPSECCVKYYNKTLKSNTPSTRGYKHSIETKLKIGIGNKGKKLSEETKLKLRQAHKKQFDDQYYIDLYSQKSKELWSDPEYLQKQMKVRSKPGFYKGNTKPHSIETKKLISEKKTGIPIHNEYSKRKISEAFSNMIWITDGKSNKRINKLELIPEGYYRGKTNKSDL